MKINQPVTQVQREFREGAILASRTDLKGIITYANKAFVEISGFSEEELLGKNHNIVRHPDMPPAAFADLWATVQTGKPWTGIVKNRCKNGDHYWVKATVTPVVRSGQVVEYMSVRVKPSQDEINAADGLYREVMAGRASLGRRGLDAAIYRIRSMPISRKLAAAYTGLIALIAGSIAAITLWSGETTLGEIERQDLLEHYQVVEDRLQSETRLAAAMALLVAEMPDVQEAFANDQRDRLLQMFKEGHQRLREEFGVRQLQFHKPPAISYLRVHKPEKFGDDLSGVRPTIVKTNADRAMVRGLDIGAFGLGLRGLVPIFRQGVHLGSVEFGMSFDETFFTGFKERYGVDLALDIFRSGSLEPFASTLAQPLTVPEEQVALVSGGETAADQLELNGVPVAVLRAPVKDFAGEVVGLLQIVVDRSDYTERMAHGRNIALLAALLAILAGLLMSWLIARSITRPLGRAVDLARQITDGNYDNAIQIDREDEAGHVLLALMAMQSRLHYDVHAVREALEENLRVRTALDNVRTNVMVADAKHNIIYLNRAVQEMFNEAADDLREVIPQFDPGRLLGANIDLFHKNPAHQRRLLESLQGVYESRLSVGSRTLKIIAVPVMTDDGQRIGTAVEWSDLTEQLAAEVTAERVAAEERRQAQENARIRVALDNVSSSVMLADTGRNIIYMNKTAESLFQEAEADIRKQLPSFSAKSLMGANIDAFHQNPAHQRVMLEQLRQTHSSEIEIGGRHMRIVANPVVDAEGARLGTAVEWTDRTQEVSVEREIEEIVDAARQGKLENRIALHGKDGFFEKLGLGINSLIEVMNAVFLDTLNVMQYMAKGDMTQKIDKDYQGVFGDVKANINTTIGNLDNMISQLRDAVDLVSTASSEISSGNSNLSARTEQQAASLEQTAASMEELTSTVKHNADNAQQANQVATSARQMAEKGGEVVRRAVSAMDEINESSRKISEIIGVIDEIAFQTNLLALNASVEAARAGEQGRGFAVVATEVRNLAGRSATAAKEIKELIKDSSGKVQIGSDLVNESGSTLSEIVNQVKKVGDIVAEIAAASSEQSAGIDQVNQAVTQMDEMTQQNAALAEQTSAASASLTDKAQEIDQLMDFFTLSSMQAREVSGSVGRAANRGAAVPAKAAVPARTSPPLATSAPKPARTADKALRRPPAPKPQAAQAQSAKQIEKPRMVQKPAVADDGDDWEEF